MKWYKFDKKVQKDMVEHRSSVDMDALWANMEADVDAINKGKKKRRGFIFWFLLTGLICLGAGLGYFVFNGSKQKVNDTIVSTENLTKSRIENDIAKQAGSKLKGEVGNETALSDDAIAAEAKQEANNKKEETEEQTALVKNRYNNVNTFNSNERSTTKVNAETKQEVALPVGSNQPQIVTKNRTAKTEKKNIENFKSSIENQTDLILKNNTTNKKYKNTSDLIQKPGVSEKRAIALESKKLLEAKEPGNSDLNKLRLKSLAALLENSGRGFDLYSEPFKTQEEKLSKEVKEFLEAERRRRNRKFRYSISVEGGLGFADRSLALKPDNTNDLTALLQLRESTEKTLETVHLGAQFHLHHKSGFTISSGLDYTQINERFEFDNTIVKTDSINVILFYYKNVNGDTIAHYGDVPVDTTTVINKRHYNKYRLIDIPILFAFEKQFDQFSLGAQLGVFMNIKMNATGRFFRKSFEDADIKEAEYFKNNVGLSYYFGLKAAYQLNSNWSVYMSPSVRFFPSDFASTTYGLEQKYSLYGMRMGVQYTID